MKRHYWLPFFLGAVFFSQPARCGTIFDEEFSGTTLDPAWQVTSGPGSYSLTANPGSLRYNMVGPLTAADWSGAPSGAWTPGLELSRSFSGSDWTLDTQVTYSLNWNADAGAQRPYFVIQFGSGTGDYLAIDRGIDQWYGSNQLEAELYSNNTVAGSDYNMLDPTDTVQSNGWLLHSYTLEVQRHSDNISVSYSFDGTTFFDAFTASITPGTSGTQQVILDGTTYLSAGSYADWNYIRAGTSADNAAPEPASLLLVGLVLGGATLARVTGKRAA